MLGYQHLEEIDPVIRLTTGNPLHADSPRGSNWGRERLTADSLDTKASSERTSSMRCASAVRMSCLRANMTSTRFSSRRTLVHCTLTGRLSSWMFLQA